jgi:transcriptional regulator with XRE-family HTH domain
MTAQDNARFANALRKAMEDAGVTQAALARALLMDAGQINRWAKGKAVPHINSVRRIEKILKADLADALDKSTPDYELFVSAPISGIAGEDIPEHHNAVARVVSAANEHVNNLIWPGRHIETAAGLLADAADIVTEKNMRALHSSQAYLYLQFAEVVRPSSAFVELGFALGRRMKVTIIIQQGLKNPFMLRGFSAVAESLDFLPKARTYEVASADEAASLIKGSGRELLGLS